MSALQKGEYDNCLGTVFSDGQLSSIIAAAHELKSPLSLIRQLSLALEQEDVSQNDRERLLHQITLTSERALSLTSDLTKVARLSDAMFQLEPINPQQLCEDVVSELTPLFSAHNRSLRVVKRKRSPLLIANRDLLRRIIVNFSDNALYYSEDNNVVNITIQALNVGKTIRLGVRDYGPALPKNIIKTLGSKLILANSPVYARPQSSGLGIYIASQFAVAMNGKIGVTRHHDGATFYVDLQASQQLSLL